MPSVMPSLFLSHGAPTLVLEDCPARHFLSGLGQTLPRPSAIVVMSAHYETELPTVSAAEDPETIYDFRGFPDALYKMQYPAPGAPEIAARIHGLLRATGFDAQIEQTRGFDHGIWNPLKLVYPNADIPVVPLSIQPNASPQHHALIGRSLSALRSDGVLLIGSGSITHNLKRFFSGSYELDSDPEPFARDFADWIAEHVEQGDVQTLLKPADAWPGGRENHPTDDHILPFYFALGAGGLPFRGRRRHRSTNYGVLAMDTFEFG